MLRIEKRIENAKDLQSWACDYWLKSTDDALPDLREHVHEAEDRTGRWSKELFELIFDLFELIHPDGFQSEYALYSAIIENLKWVSPKVPETNELYTFYIVLEDDEQNGPMQILKQAFPNDEKAIECANGFAGSRVIIIAENERVVGTVKPNHTKQFRDARDEALKSEYTFYVHIEMQDGSTHIQVLKTSLKSDAEAVEHAKMYSGRKAYIYQAYRYVGQVPLMQP